MSDEEDIESILDEADFFLENYSVTKTSVPENFSTPQESEPPKLVLELVSEHELCLIEAVSTIERHFWATSELPGFEQFLDAGITIEELKEVVNPKLAGRGIPTYSFNKVATPVGDGGFDPRFILACNVMCRATGKSKGAKFKDLSTLGVNEPMWNAWLSIPSYFEYAKKIMEVQFESVTDLDAKMGIARNVANGDLQSIKYFHEFTNRYRPQDQNTINLMAIIQALMEILAQNVTADVFDKIANQLEATPVGELMKAG